MNLAKTVSAGVVATAVMSLIGFYLAPMMGLPKMDFGQMLGSNNPMMAMPYWAGWAIHFMMGIIFAIVFVKVVAPVLKGSYLIRGLVFGMLLFVLAQLLVMPMMGAGVFAGGHMPTIVGSLLGHLVFGAILGLMSK
ncbi:DUF6789 family protein [Marinicella litoralis]|uniref:Uncharacterized protein n=1 Tax=Marinicella litoralis TaxID=644220 RepID=A0A4R6XM64_9GAMM|nr:DUF6789 family protein [Marinicella litoralis]TDR20676.1 hypothetical protein C8D91_1652 [Marinicella litoralis]